MEHHSPSMSELNYMEAQLHGTPPKGYPTNFTYIGQKIGSGTVVDAPEPKLCPYCNLTPCMVDVYFDELLEVQSESQIILCDPMQVTCRKLEAFFRRKIVQLYSLEHMKKMGQIPPCAMEKCEELAESKWSGFDDPYLLW